MALGETFLSGLATLYTPNANNVRLGDKRDFYRVRWLRMVDLSAKPWREGQDVNSEDLRFNPSCNMSG